MTTGIRYIGAYDHSGYGTAARRLLLGLQGAGVPVTWTPMVGGGGLGLWYAPLPGPGVSDPDLGVFGYRDIPYDTVILHLAPEYTLYWRQVDPDKRLVLHTVWETDRLPPHWRFFLELADLVIVPSTWNQQVFERAGLRVPVAVLPHIALPSPAPTGPPPIKIRGDDFVFLAVEAWTARKNLECLIRCYLDTFTADDPVCLVLKTGARDFTQRTLWRQSRSTAACIRRLRREYRHAARVQLVSGVWGEDDLRRLYARADCYVSLSHGEGWGLGAFDAAAHGKPVITTAFGGPLDYLSPADAFLVRCRMVPVRDEAGKPSFLPGQRWAQPDPVHARELMRFVFAHRDEAASRGQRLQRAIAGRFNAPTLVKQFMDILAAPPAPMPAEVAAP